MFSTDFNVVLPEVVLSAFAMAALLFGVYTNKDKSAGMLVWATSGLMLALALWIGLGGDGARAAFGGMFVDGNP